MTRSWTPALPGIGHVVAGPAGLQPCNRIRSEPTALGFGIMPAALRYTVCLISELMLGHATYSGFARSRGTVVVPVVPRWSQKSVTSRTGVKHFALLYFEFSVLIS